MKETRCLSLTWITQREATTRKEDIMKLQTKTSESNLPPAIELIERGWHVLPLYEISSGTCCCGKPNCTAGKHPRIRDGAKGATIDLHQVQEWWTQWPQANVGVTTGADSGIVVLDIDPRNGGDSSLQQLENDHGDLPPTVMAATGGGGQHLIFQHPGLAIGNRRNLAGYPGIDLKGDGGYIVAPPSNHVSGGHYAWMPDHRPGEIAIAPIPEFLIDLAQQGPVTELTDYESQSWDGSLPPAVDQLAKNHGKLDIRIRHRDPTGLNDQSDSGIDGSIACIIALHHPVGADIEAAIRWSRAQARLPRRGESYFQSTVGKALSFAKDRVPPRRTDIGNSERFVAENRDRILWVPEEKTWHLWRGNLWAKDYLGEIQRLAKQTIKQMRELSPFSEDSGKWQAWCAKSEMRNGMNSMIDLSRSELATRVGDFDSDPSRLNTGNGLLDLRTGDLKPHSPQMLIRKITTCDWEPEASSRLWEDALATLLPDHEVRAFLQRAVGYSLLGDLSEKAFFYCYGPTNSGKSTVIGAIRRALGDYATTADFRTFLKSPRDGSAATPDLDRLRGIRFIQCSEVEPGRGFNVSLLKGWTGRDGIVSRPLYGAPSEFSPQATLWFLGNDRPNVPHRDEGMWDRLHVIPFEQSLPRNKQDGALPTKLREPEHLAAILTWAVRGLRDYRSSGLASPERVRLAGEDYKSDMDPLAAFLEEACEFGTEKHYRQRSGLLYSAYKEFAEQRGMHPIADKEFVASLKSRGFRGSPINGYRTWYGLRVRPESEFNNIAERSASEEK